MIVGNVQPPELCELTERSRDGTIEFIRRKIQTLQCNAFGERGRDLSYQMVRGQVYGYQIMADRGIQIEKRYWPGKIVE
jgi:hypothetical protein